jgi:hypothetical protein
VRRYLEFYRRVWGGPHARVRWEAERIAADLIDSFLGSDQKVSNMPSFRSALSQALREAREQGQVDLSGDVLTLI